MCAPLCVCTHILCVRTHISFLPFGGNSMGFPFISHTLEFHTNFEYFLLTKIDPFLLR